MAEFTYSISASYLGEGLEDTNFYLFHTECGNFNNLIEVDGSIFLPSSSLASGFSLTLDSSINTLYLYPVSGECPLGCGYNYVLNLIPPASPTPSISVTPPNTPSQTPSVSISTTPGASTTPSISTSRTPSASAPPSATPSTSITPTTTPSISTSGAPGVTPTPTISNTPSVSISNTPSISITRTPSISTTPSITSTPANTTTPSISVTPSISTTPSISISRTPSISVTPSISISRTPSISISRTPSASPPPPAYVTFGTHLVTVGFSGTQLTAVWSSTDHPAWQRGQLAAALGSYINSNNSFQIYSSTGTNLLASVTTNVNGATNVSYSDDGSQMVLTATNLSAVGGGFGLLRYVST